jgi:hypothetical protein
MGCKQMLVTNGMGERKTPVQRVIEEIRRIVVGGSRAVGRTIETLVIRVRLLSVNDKDVDIAAASSKTFTRDDPRAPARILAKYVSTNVKALLSEIVIRVSNIVSRRKL